MKIVLFDALFTIVLCGPLFASLWVDFGESNTQFDYWYDKTALIPIILFSIASLFWGIPFARWTRSMNYAQAFKNRDYSEIATKLIHPSTTGLKINRVIRIILAVSSLLFFLANIVLIFIGVFMF